MAVLKQKIDGIWQAVSEQNRIVDAAYYVGENVVLTLKRNADGLTDTAYLSGSGATKDYARGEAKPWYEYIPKITAIHIGSGVTSIGAYLFAEHVATKTLVFEDSSTITHLGDRCFWRCQFGGEYTFPGLLGSIEVTVDDDGKISSSIRPGVMMRAFAACTNLEGITLSDAITTIGGNAFVCCTSLRRVSGLKNVQSVGFQAFHYTPRLECVDLNPTVCRYVGEAAFSISPAMSHLDMSLWAQTSFGYNACASGNWTEEQLTEIRAIKLPTVKLWNSGADSVYKYNESAGKEYLYGTWEYNGQEETQYLELGCHSGALSIIWSILTGKTYNCIGEWWLKEVYAKDNAIGKNHYNDIDAAVVEVSGLVETSEIFANNGIPALKTAIAAKLKSGNPLICNLWTNQTYGHAVAIIGADTAKDKLIVADSVKTSGTRGSVYEIALEDIIGVDDGARVEAYEVAT